MKIIRHLSISIAILCSSCADEPLTALGTKSYDINEEPTDSVNPGGCGIHLILESSDMEEERQDITL